jgi:flagellin
LDAVAAGTKSGTSKLLDGAYNGSFLIGANGTTDEQVSLNLSTAAITALGATSGGDGSQITGLTADGLNVGSTDLSSGIRTQAGAVSALAAIDKAITGVSTVRSYVGATENRFTGAVTGLGVSVQNLSDAESRIMDTDMAAETVALSRAQIQSEAVASLLAQANTSRGNVMRLLLG